MLTQRDIITYSPFSYSERDLIGFKNWNSFVCKQTNSRVKNRVHLLDLSTQSPIKRERNVVPTKLRYVDAYVIFRECLNLFVLTHWGRVTHICVNKLTIIGPDNGLSPGRRQAIIWTNAGILLFGPLGTNFSEILIGIQTFSFKKLRLKTSSA